ncbi:hypothetical protein [Endozoicomonas sp. 8E]|uniref:hypothetical protein n=1 Tax=Endozoicomonas sp. 8E TaxID=3035692 RepID=UPI0029393261|nr:hypothetical protein [Endozoicomonas sp. 8E]WOG29539.1 hypothetical protein P6910_07785 [Endozoicomonas sp. 8E]
MTNPHHNALSLAVAVAISSSIINTEALAARKLQTNAYVLGSGNVVKLRSEVMVQPTLGDDQQPIPKSFTTTYPYEPSEGHGFVSTTMSFTEILYGIGDGVSSVDQFETGENDVAQKYIKVLKVGDEGVFRFTHNLEEKELVIEVRGGMTDQDSVEIARDQLVWSSSLQPLTKIANHLQLAKVLKAAAERAGNLGSNDHYVGLATIEVEKVEVNGRTFMRLIAGGDQPPELHRLGQSLFVNDEALLAAAASAYIQVHVLEEDLQQKALNELLAYNKPVGYIVDAEDATGVYHVPAGYPKLEIAESPGEDIVFHGLMQNPDDVAFVEKLYKFWIEAEGNNPVPEVKAELNKRKLKNYRYVIRSKQMAVLEELVARHDADVDKDQLTVLSDEDKLAARSLVYYESLQQALALASPGEAYGSGEFEFTPEHIRIASLVITPTRMYRQLLEHFGFKPVLKNLLMNPHFFQHIRKVLPVVGDIKEAQIDLWKDEEFTFRVMTDMARQLFELHNDLEELRIEHAKLGKLNEKIFRETAAELGIYNWDNTQTPEEQAILLRKKIHEITRELATTFAATEQPDYEIIITILAAVEDQFGMTPDNKNDLLARFQSVQQHIQHKTGLADDEAPQRLANLESNLGLISDDKDTPETRQQAILQFLEQQEALVQRHILPRTIIEAGKAAAIKARYATIAAHLNIQNFDSSADVDTQQEHLLQKIEEMNAHKQLMLQKIKTMDIQQDVLLHRIETLHGQDNSYTEAKQNALAEILGIKLSKNSVEKNQDVLEKAAFRVVHSLARLEKELKEIRTPDHPKASPEVLRKLTAVEKTLKMVDIDSEGDVYDRRNAISEKIQTYLAGQRAEEEALEVLKNTEEILGIQVSEGDNKLERLDRVRKKLDDNNVIKKLTEQQYYALWREDTRLADYKKRKGKHQKLLLYALIADADQLAKGRQYKMLQALESNLDIDAFDNAALRKRDKALIAKLADNLKVELKDVGLQRQVQALRSRIPELRLKVFHRYEDEGLSRNVNNEIAHQLNIEGYNNNACVNDQINLIEETLCKLSKEMSKLGWPTITERVAAIENELDRQMARLGPKPRYLLDREVARARRAVREAENELEMADRKMGIFLQHARGNIALNQEMKKFQTELGLSAGDEQTNKERAEEIINFLLGYSADVRYKIIEKLNAKTNLEVSIHGDPASLQEANYVLAVDRYTYTPLHAAADEIDGIRGELPLTRKMYAQVTEFLHEHDRKSMDLANAMAEEVAARENLVRKEQQMFDYENINGNPSSSDKIDRDRLNSALNHKYQAALSAKQDLADHDALLEATEAAVGLKPDASDTNERRINALRNKQLELGGDDGTGGKIRQLIEEPSLQMRLEAELEARKADVVRMEKVLKAAEEAVKNDRSLVQYSEKQAKLLTDMNDFMQQHPLKKRALEAAIGLNEAAMESDKTIPFLSVFNFDDEFAPIRLQAMAGDKLTFKQASRIVEGFKRLKTSFPKSPVIPPEGQPEDVLEEIEIMVLNAMYEMEIGSQPFKDEIRRIGKTAIDFAGHEPEELNSFSEYFAAHSASANKIITLLREGLISKVELENYIKAVRGVDGYQAVAEFEHLLGYTHGVDVPRFKVVVGILSDEGAEEFMQTAFNPVTVMATHPAGMKESVVGMKEYAAAVIANYVLDDIAFENGRRTTAFLSNLQDTLTPYANVAGLSESDLIKAIHNTLMLAHVAAVEWQLNDYWVKPSAFLVQAVTWYYTSYKPLLATHTVWQAADLSLSNMAFLYLLDLTNRGDYLHRMLIPFQHWLEHYGVDPDRTAQYAHHNGIEKVSEVGGLAMPLGKAASSVILLRTGSMLFARQYNANPQMYRSILRLLPEIVKSMGSGQGIQVPLLHRVTPQTMKMLTSATAGLVLGPISTAGAYTHGLISGFTSAQTFGFALASGLTFDFFMNDNKMLTQWLGGPLGRTLDRINRWRGAGETDAEYEIRTEIASPQRFGETDAAYTHRVEANGMIHGWTRHENYLQFRERRDRTIKLFENGWEKYFQENVPKWSFSHAESIPYSYTLGTFYNWQRGDDSH